MPPDTPRRTFGLGFIGGSGAPRASSVERGNRLFFLDARLSAALFAGGFEDSALFAVVPANVVVFELLGREACRLQRPLERDLRPSAPHELFGAPRDQKDEPELAVHPVGNGLDHSKPLSAEFAEEALEARLLPGVGDPSGPNDGL